MPSDDSPFLPDATSAAAADYEPPQAGGGLPPELRALDAYADVKFLDKGGMGAVYLATNKLMDRPEVLKVISRQFLDRPELVERFLREIRAAAKLNHPNVVTAYAAYQSAGNLIFAMEFVPGESLSDAVKDRGPMPPANACYYCYQVALGLQHAHEQGMVHRDIKPGNLRVKKDGRKRTVKILDFGLAKATSERDQELGRTGTGVALGTPEYMPPEQASDAASADIRADIYSLGATLFCLLAGQAPFRAKSAFDMMLAHRTQMPPRLDVLVPNLPAGLADVVDRMLEKEPDKRFQTPAEVAHVLSRFFQAGPAAAQRAKPIATRSGPLPTTPPQPTPGPPSVGGDDEDSWVDSLPDAEDDPLPVARPLRSQSVSDTGAAAATPPVPPKGPPPAKKAEPKDLWKDDPPPAAPQPPPVQAKPVEAVEPKLDLPPPRPGPTPLLPPRRYRKRYPTWVWLAGAGVVLYLLACLMFAGVFRR